MNRELSYIFKASLMLIAGVVLFFLITKILFINSKEETQIVYRTMDSDITEQKISEGRSLFMSKCASCHNLFKDMTGPALMGFETRGPWADRKKVYEWIRNPAAFMSRDNYTRNLKVKFGSVMLASPDLTEGQIDGIIEYINSSGKSRNLPIALIN